MQSREERNKSTENATFFTRKLMCHRERVQTEHRAKRLRKHLATLVLENAGSEIHSSMHGVSSLCV